MDAGAFKLLLSVGHHLALFTNYKDPFMLAQVMLTHKT